MKNSGEFAKNNNASENTEIDNTIEKLPKPVYYIESPNDRTVLVGMDVACQHLENDTSLISWHDMNHVRIMTASEIRKDEDYFAFKRIEAEGGGTYFFAPMTLDVYNDKVKGYLGSQSFDNEKAMIDYLKNTDW